MINSRLFSPRNLMLIAAVAIMVHAIVSPFHSLLDGNNGAN